MSEEKIDGVPLEIIDTPEFLDLACKFFEQSSSEEFNEAAYAEARSNMANCINRHIAAARKAGQQDGRKAREVAPAARADLLEAPPMPDAFHEGGLARALVQARDAIWAERVRVALGMNLLPMGEDDSQWYFNCDGHYIDVERDASGKYSVFFKNRKDGAEAWLDQAVQPAVSTVELSDEQIWHIASEVRSGNSGVWPGDVTFARALLAKQAAQSPVVGRDAERDFLEEWLMLASTPMGIECCGQSAGECCGNGIAVERDANEVISAMAARHRELSAAAINSKEG